MHAHTRAHTWDMYVFTWMYAHVHVGTYTHVHANEGQKPTLAVF